MPNIALEFRAQVYETDYRTVTLKFDYITAVNNGTFTQVISTEELMLIPVIDFILEEVKKKIKEQIVKSERKEPYVT